MTPSEREEFQFNRIELFSQMESDWSLIDNYRANERFYLERLVATSRMLGRLDERLGDVDDA
ncbi:hypothetical protein JIG36_42655 [Actinoplanes sp. LDG1-06]|uniref:Uncharacterized protein n=1 Tax=Paractinoplanes ovalisporus TaxID=2810368 RepID=A0ABS2AR18_9ACTN|nr:hypothetical protein [Actinoplanes ovalisporus]MBM2622225.1 hypothetical protein [Actinoplanes ovalisporus]